MSNKTYNRLKLFTLVHLPALTAFYGVVGLAWGVGYLEQTLTTLVALDTLLGAMLQIKKSQYDAKNNMVVGDLLVIPQPGKDNPPILAAELDAVPEEVLAGKDEIKLKVKRQ